MEVKVAAIAEHLPIKAGDVLLIGSDVVGLALAAQERGEALDLDRLIELFQQKITERGTLLFPTFNFDFCEGGGFDIKKSVSQTGALSRAAIKRADFSRTRHPIHSFAVWGRHQTELCGMRNKESFGLDSPFHFLYEIGAKMLIIGIGFQGAFTFAHYVEERENVPYRYFKDFTGDYTDENGVTEQKTYSMFVRAVEQGIESFLDPIGEVLEKKGVASLQKINGVEFRTVDLRGAYHEIVNDIRENSGKNLFRSGVRP